MKPTLRRKAGIIQLINEDNCYHEVENYMSKHSDAHDIFQPSDVTCWNDKVQKSKNLLMMDKL